MYWSANASVIDLNALLTPAQQFNWTLTAAWEINEFHTIVGESLFDPDGPGPQQALKHIFIMNVPEPALGGVLAFALLLCAAGRDEPRVRAGTIPARMKTKLDIAKNWLPRYTGTPLEEFGDYILLTNLHDYVSASPRSSSATIRGDGRPMQTATNAKGLTIINFGMGSANAATIMDLLVARAQGRAVPRQVRRAEELDRDRPLHPADRRHPRRRHQRRLPAAGSAGAAVASSCTSSSPTRSIARNQDYRTGVIYTTNRRVWEWDEDFKERLEALSVIGIDMETATIFIVGHVNEISRGRAAAGVRHADDPRGREDGRVGQDGDRQVRPASPGDRHRRDDRSRRKGRADQTFEILMILQGQTIVRPITDEREVRRRDAYYRPRILIWTTIGYGVFYFVRKNLSIAMPVMQQQLGISKTSLGLFLTLHGLLYGVSKFINGMIGDRARAPTFMAIGLFTSAMLNIFFGLSTAVVCAGDLLDAQRLVSGNGLSAVRERLLTHWFSPKELATKMALWNASHTLGRWLSRRPVRISRQPLQRLAAVLLRSRRDRHRNGGRCS